MRVWVSYVVHAGDLGSRILGVRPTIEAARLLAQAHYNDQFEDGRQKDLSWSFWEDLNGQGEQAILHDETTYIVEECELEVSSRVDDDPEGRFTWDQRQILRLTIENGRLAQQVLEQAGMYKPLEERVKQLSGYIDHLIEEWAREKGAKPDSYTFPGGELWEMNDGSR